MVSVLPPAPTSMGCGFQAANRLVDLLRVANVNVQPGSFLPGPRHHVVELPNVRYTQHGQIGLLRLGHPFR